MMSNFPAQFEPQHWEDVKYQPVVVSTIRRWLREDDFPGYVFVEGKSGCGKTSTIRLAIKTTHCLNRPPGGDEPCGHCAVCKGDPIEQTELNNVVWVKPGSQEVGDKVATYESQIKSALLLAERGPRLTNHPHRDILFVVFDEAHLMPDSLRQRAMVFADCLQPNQGKVVLIFNTMEPENIREEPRKALRSRGGWLRFGQPTEAQIEAYLLSKFANLTPAAAQMLAKVSERSLRGALSAYKTVYDYDRFVTESSVAEVFRLSQPSERRRLWTMLQNNVRRNELDQYLNELLTNLDHSVLMDALWSDIENQLQFINDANYQFALELFYQYQRSPRLINARYILNQLRGRTILDPKLIGDETPNRYLQLTQSDS